LRDQQTNLHKELNEQIKQSLKLPTELQAAIKAWPVGQKAKEAEKKLQAMCNELSGYVRGNESFTRAGYAVGVQSSVVFNVGEVTRSNYLHGTVSLSKVGRDHVFHELGHYLEEAPGNRVAARRFRDVRTIRLSTDDLGEKTGCSGMRGERCLRQLSGTKKLPDYARKVYTSGHTEILSMGLEKFMRSPSGFMHSDPEWFDLTLGALRGEFKPKGTS
jgi:hypothetical protein